MNIMPPPAETMRSLEMQALRDANERMRTALEFYAKPHVYGTGAVSIFLDVGGVARAALREVASTEKERG